METARREVIKRRVPIGENFEPMGIAPLIAEIFEARRNQGKVLVKHEEQYHGPADLVGETDFPERVEFYYEVFFDIYIS